MASMEMQEVGAAVSSELLPQALDDVTVNIAVMGESGSGVSTLVNTLRGLTSGQDRAAPTGTPEATTVPTEHSYPRHPNVKLWDLPGVKTINFAQYLKEIKIDQYDIVILVISESFRQVHAQLGEEIQTRGKELYLVRTKINLHSSQSDPEVLERIRQQCLKDSGLESCRVFLISGIHAGLYDFPQLVNTLEENINKVKKDAIFNPEKDLDEEDAGIFAQVKCGGLHAVVDKLQSYFKAQEEAQVNIAITGESGTGKSTFINTIRGLKDNDKGAAPTDVTECTKEPTPYFFPKYPNVKSWDLPGIGTTSYPAAQYLEKMNFNRYDFFIIVSSERLKENDIILAKAIHKLGKRFYFIRSKIDNNLESEKRKQEQRYNEVESLDKIRKYCVKQLNEVGMASSTVFLISGYDISVYDFPDLLETFKKDLPKHKKRNFMTSLPNTSLHICKQKQKTLKQDIWKVSALSCAVGAVPIPGLSVVCNITHVVSELQKYYQTFGLDDETLQKLAHKAGKTKEELKAVIKSPLKNGISAAVVTELMKQAVGKVAVNTAFGLCAIPFLGTVPAGIISYTASYQVLMSSLRQLAEDSYNVLLKSLK